jgi:Sec-independent protein secretion pathway component TatC
VIAWAAVAALLPGDAIALALETVPLYLLFELSLLLATCVERRAAAARASAARCFTISAAGVASASAWLGRPIG